MTESDDTPVLPERTSDETDTGWGDDTEPRGADPDDDTRRYLDDVPPHHT
jgi:hypothetical protein